MDRSGQRRSGMMGDDGVGDGNSFSLSRGPRLLLIFAKAGMVPVVPVRILRRPTTKTIDRGNFTISLSFLLPAQSSSSLAVGDHFYLLNALWESTDARAIGRWARCAMDADG